MRTREQMPKFATGGYIPAQKLPWWTPRSGWGVTHVGHRPTELQADLDELEAMDPAVAAASKRLDEVTARITGREHPSGGLIAGPSGRDDDSIPTFMLPGYGYGTASSLTATATDDGITIEMQCGATILAVHLSPDEWEDFRAEGDDARDAFEAGALDPDHDRDLER